MVSESLLFRKATSRDGNQAVSLLQQALSTSGDFIFGNGDKEKSHYVLKRLFLARENRFYYQHVFLAEKGSQISGLLLAFRSNLLAHLDLLTGFQLLRILTPGEMLKLVMRLIKLPMIREAGKNEFYISDLAVSPEFRCQGIGTALLDFAEDQARELELRTCSLIVTMENEKARQLYQRKGYKLIEYFRSNSFFSREITPGIVRMVKEL